MSAGRRAMTRIAAVAAAAALWVLLPVVPVFAIGSAPKSGARPLSLAERIDAQRRIETVYWEHRIWPESNPGPKPPLSAVLPDTAHQERVVDDLRKSSALERFWRRPLTAGQLQAEVERMARETRDPKGLHDLFTALGNDPLLIRETLARPLLADRLLRSWYAFDRRFHEGPEGQARAGRGENEVRPIEYRPAPSAAASAKRNSHAAAESPITWLEPEAWSALLDRIDQGDQDSVEESEESFVRRTVESRSAGRVVMTERVWHKRPFESWWNEAAPSLPAAEAIIAPGTDGLENSLPVIPEALAGGCTPDTWLPDGGMSGIDALSGHTAVWTGTEMIVWGGMSGVATGTGFRYTPATDTWAMVDAAGAPSPRSDHTAVWTGTEMIIWGGRSGAGTTLNTGARYNPADGTWTPTNPVGAPTARADHAAVWAGPTYGMIVNGGDIPASDPSTTSRYDPATDSWHSAVVEGVVRFNHTAVWTGSEMLVWGGDAGLLIPTNTGGRYNPGTNSWTALPTLDAPDARYFHTAVWTGTEMIIWGGDTGSGSPSSTGARYNNAGDFWSALPSTTASPSARFDHSAVWSGTEMIIWGGFGTIYAGDGARYNPGADLWSAIPVVAEAPTARSRHSAVWTGTEMIVWGGRVGSQAQRTGGRYDPTQSSWVPTSTMASVPSPRWHHTGTWTGNEMVVWGGEDTASVAAGGGRYLPATGTWLATATSGAPTARAAHSAVWTGTHVIIWGGGAFPNGVNSQVNTGARYSPTTNTWSATSVTGAPIARAYHSAIWTGTQMVVWGGGNLGNIWRSTGGRYDPVANVWSATSTGTGTASARDSHSAVWTGSEMIVWGGYNGAGDLNTGSRYDPALDTWTALPTAGAAAARWGHRAVWTGSQMIVWGGTDYNTDTQLATGGRYTPATNLWSTIAAPGTAAVARTNHGAVWTGSRMIVWGGINAGTPLSSGALYDPAANSWTPTSNGANLPSARSGHATDWTGTQDGRMFVWGGTPVTATGGTYCALSCSSPAPSGASVVSMTDSAGASQVSWTSLAGASGYDVVKGDLNILRSTGGNFAQATLQCLASDSSGSTAGDGAIPAVGGGFWYLQRGRSCGGTGTYDSATPSVPAENRDPGIGASGAACP